MKNLFFLIAMTLASLSVTAQVPQGISHQAVIRNAVNELVTNSPIGIKVSILQDSANGAVVYAETHLPESNANGLISFVIGQGTVVTGLFSAINWASGGYFVRTEADPTGGTNYTITGTSQLLSVPFALLAQKVSGSIENNIVPPVANELPASYIQPFSATLNGIVNAKGFLTDIVFQFGTTTSYGTNYTSANSPVKGTYNVWDSVNLTGLQSATTYHYRIRASNPVDVVYSDDMEFTTLASPPILITSSVTFSTDSAWCGGNITYDGGAPVTARGVVWSTDPGPTLADYYTVDGSGTGTFASILTGLTPATTYYVRAYATNSVGTAYGNEISFTTYNGPCPGTPYVTDIDGNVYNTMLIGNQCWMKENLKTTKYRNGTSITYPGTNNTAWQSNTTGAYAWYNNDISNKNTYGALYNWYAVNNTNNLCPTGWHVPTDAEWTQLMDYVVAQGYPNMWNDPNGAGNALKSCRQVNSPIGGFCNTTAHPRWEAHGTHNGFDAFGFSAFPGGIRSIVGTFENIGNFGYWWSSTVYSSASTWSRYMLYYDSNVGRSSNIKEGGFSVRCLRD